MTERFPAKKWERHHGVPGSFPPYAEELVKPRVGACLTSDRERERGEMLDVTMEKKIERARAKAERMRGEILRIDVVDPM